MRKKSYIVAMILTIFVGPIGVFYCGVGPGLFWCGAAVAMSMLAGPIGAMLAWFASILATPLHVAVRRSQDAADIEFQRYGIHEDRKEIRSL